MRARSAQWCSNWICKQQRFESGNNRDIRGLIEGIRQYDSCDTGQSDNVNIAAEHQEPGEVLSPLGNTSNPPVYGEDKCC